MFFFTGILTVATGIITGQIGDWMFRFEGIEGRLCSAVMNTQFPSGMALLMFGFLLFLWNDSKAEKKFNRIEKDWNANGFGHGWRL